MQAADQAVVEKEKNHSFESRESNVVKPEKEVGSAAEPLGLFFI